MKEQKKPKHFTKTATFIFPLLGINKSEFAYTKTTFSRIENCSRFHNAFLYDKISNVYDNYVSIAIDNYRDVKFDSFYRNMLSHDLFVDSYEVEEVLILVFRIPDDKQEDFNLIKNGAYSKVSTESKQLIMSNHFFDGGSSVIPMILHKSNELREIWEKKIDACLKDREVWAILNDEFETLTYQKLDKLIVKKLKMSNEFI